MNPRYPVYIPSKDRYQKDRALTIKALLKDKVPFRVVVEPAQARHYQPWISERDQLLMLPRDNYGTSIDARNFIRDHAEAEGHARHWQLDDNISLFYRLWEGERIPAHAGVSLRVVEDLTDRYENVGISGMNYTMFVPRDCAQPVYRNVHVYSCCLFDHRMPYRWRLRYNEDTNICLQALTHGWATLLVNAFNAQKAATMYMGGGNTESLYRREEGDQDVNVRDTQGRYEMAELLRSHWPGLVTVARKFRRYQHSVNWRAFEDVELRLRPDVDLEQLDAVNEYGLTLQRVRVPRSAKVAQSHTQYARVLAEIGCDHPLWRGLPAFRAVSQPPKLVVKFHSEAERDQMLTKLAVTISKRTNGTPSVWWPPRSRNDYASLKFLPTDPVRPADAVSVPHQLGEQTEAI